jgi:CRISPR-associated endonuclease/helicase Cas3
MEPLLAKSGAGAPTLAEHTCDVMDAAEALFGGRNGPTRLGKCWLRFFKIPDVPWNLFHGTLRASAAFHDWGKANDQMDATLRGRPTDQLLRHEHLSGLMLVLDGVWEWIGDRPDIDREIMLSSVLSHHLKFEMDEYAKPIAGVKKVEVLYHDSRFAPVADVIAAAIDRTDGPRFPVQSTWAFDRTRNATAIGPLRERVSELLSPLLRSDVREDRLRFLQAVRAALIAADAAGSGLRREKQEVTDWIRGQFAEEEVCNAGLIEGVIGGRIAELARLGKTYRPQTFQDECEKLPRRALLLAPCGSGKTLAAWRWIKARVADPPAKRVIFLYPTRATATEGFRDYVSWAPEGTLIHGTAAYELDGMFPDVSDPRARGGFATDPRLFGVGFWSKRVFSATVDAFLAFMGHAYGPTCLLPVLADSVVVIDEVHSFDDSMFSKLIGFLRWFDLPVLCMTATLPEPRITAIRKASPEVRVYGKDDLPADLRGAAGTPRYVVRRELSKEAVLAKVAKAVEENERVLWVVNQVRRAQELARELQRRFPHIPVHCYHSRFKLTDRKIQHERVVTAFKTATSAVIGVVTQVCEMSLDLDADLLITEDCPITSLIQRMGRCRRDWERLKKLGPGQVIIYPFEKPEPYSPTDLVGLDDFLSFIETGTAINQLRLEEGLRKFGPKAPMTERYSSFLDSGPEAVGGEDPFREIEPFTRRAILRGDLNNFVTALNAERAARDQKGVKHTSDGFILPVPRGASKRPDPVPGKWPRQLFVADEACYDPLTGFWHPPAEGGA